MTDINRLEKTRQTFIITGNGKNKEEAYTRIFERVKQLAYESVDGVLLQMEPEEVYILSTDEKTKKEKFLFLFFPRDKTEVTIEVRLIVSIKYLPL